MHIYVGIIYFCSFAFAFTATIASPLVHGPPAYTWFSQSTFSIPLALEKKRYYYAGPRTWVSLTYVGHGNICFLFLFRLR